MSNQKKSLDQEQERRISDLEYGQKEILALLRPIAETYSTVSKMGKWFMGLMVFISILLGVILNSKNLLNK